MDWTENDVGVTTRKTSPYFYVKIPGRAGGYVSSGQTTRKKAIAWALLQASGGISIDVTLREYGRDFFIPGLCPIVRRRERAQGSKSVKHWDTLRQVWKDYVLAEWGNMMVAGIRPAKVFDWVSGDLKTIKEFGEEGKKSSRPISTARRNTIMVALRLAFDQAVFDELLPGNPLKAIPRLSDDKKTERGVFTEKELLAMFPADNEALDVIWAGRIWAALYLVLADTGLRPSEALALRWTNWHPSSRAFVVYEKIDSRGQPGPLKTAGKGVSKKVALVSQRTAEILEGIWEAKKPTREALLFPAQKFAHTEGQPMRVAVAGNHFVTSLSRARIAANGRTLYSLRHTANTGFRTNYGDEATRLLMGHKTSKMTDHYDHPEDAELVARALKAVGRPATTIN